MFHGRVRANFIVSELSSKAIHFIVCISFKILQIVGFFISKNRNIFEAQHASSLCYQLSDFSTLATLQFDSHNEYCVIVKCDARGFGSTEFLGIIFFSVLREVELTSTLNEFIELKFVEYCLHFVIKCFGIAACAQTADAIPKTLLFFAQIVLFLAEIARYALADL